MANAEIGEALLDTAAVNVFLASGGTRGAFDIADEEASGDVWRDLLGLRLNAPRRETISMRADGERREGRVSGPNTGAGSLLWTLDDGVIIVDRGWPHRFQIDRTSAGTAGVVGDGAILSPMPGRIIAVAVAKGDVVAKGQTLVTLEAMKMEHSLVAPFDGTVAELSATEGGQVGEGAVLVRIDAVVGTGQG